MNGAPREAPRTDTEAPRKVGPAGGPTSLRRPEGSGKFGYSLGPPAGGASEKKADRELNLLSVTFHVRRSGLRPSLRAYRSVGRFAPSETFAFG